MPERYIACWMSEKKLQKINWKDFENTCKKHDFNVFKISLDVPLEAQGQFCVFLHKLTDIIVSALHGDSNCLKIINMVEEYLNKHPMVTVIDPISHVRRLLNRHQCYTMINATNLHEDNIFTPRFCDIKTLDTNNCKMIGEDIKFPIICKPTLGHGSRAAHKMTIIFNEKGLLNSCEPPCVVQNFINHNARLYKIFIVGERFHVVERPSLKNFYSGNFETIHFESGDVSKAGAHSALSILDPNDSDDGNRLKAKIAQKISTTLRLAFGMELLGVDVVIENITGNYQIIDVNAYPGYDEFPDFFDALLDCIKSRLLNPGKQTMTTANNVRFIAHIS